jgi:hypothetical protein
MKKGRFAAADQGESSNGKSTIIGNKMRKSSVEDNAKKDGKKAIAFAFLSDQPGALLKFSFTLQTHILLWEL